MGFGADLIADDQVLLTRSGDQIYARAPTAITGLIEARGIGLLNAAHQDTARVVLFVDLGTPEKDRLPQLRTKMLLGQKIPLLNHVQGPHFAPAILQYLKAGRRITS